MVLGLGRHLNICTRKLVKGVQARLWRLSMPAALSLSPSVSLCGLRTQATASLLERTPAPKPERHSAILSLRPREHKIRRLISEGNSEASSASLADMVGHERAAFIRGKWHRPLPNRHYSSRVLLSSWCRIAQCRISVLSLGKRAGVMARSRINIAAPIGAAGRTLMPNIPSLSSLSG